MAGFTVTVTPTGSGVAPVTVFADILLGASVTQAGAASATNGVAATLPQATITPTYLHSTIYGAVIGLASGGAFTNYDANTAFDSQTVNGTLQIGSFHSYPGFTTPGLPVVVGSSSGSNLNLAALEIAHGPTQGINTLASSLVVSPFPVIPPAGALIVLRITTNGGAGTAGVRVSDSLGLITWVEGAKSNTANQGYAGVWYGVVPGPRYVQDTKFAGSVSGSQQQLTFNQPTLAGNTPVIMADWFNNSLDISTGWVITDDAAGGSNTYAVATADGNLPPAASVPLSGAFAGSFIAYCVGAPKPCQNITIHNNLLTNFFLHAVNSEWSNVGSVDAGLAFSGTLPGGTGDFSGMVTTSGLNELLLAVVDASVGVNTVSNGLWQFPSDSTVFFTMGGQFTPGTFPATWAGSGGSGGQQYTGATLALKPPGAGPPPSSGLLMASFP